MSPNASDEESRLKAIPQVFKAQSLAGYSLILPLVTRLPFWVWITCGVLVLLHATLPQKSKDRLAWWRCVLGRDAQHRDGRDADHVADRGGQALRAIAGEISPDAVCQGVGISTAPASRESDTRSG